MTPRAKLPIHDHEPFIAKMERASEEGDADFVAANMDGLETLIAQLQDRQHELPQLEGRARVTQSLKKSQ